MKKKILYAIVIAASFWIQCKDKDLECGNFNVGEALLMPESKQFIDQYAGKKLIFKNVDGQELVFFAENLFFHTTEKTILRIRCISPDNFWVDWGDYVDSESEEITFKTTTTSLPNLQYYVLPISQGLPPDTLHYDVALLNFNVICPISKRGVSSRKDLALGNRYIGDTTLLGKPFEKVFKNLYNVNNGNSIRLYKRIDYIKINTVLSDDDIYFTASQGIVAFRYKNIDNKLWVLDRVD